MSKRKCTNYFCTFIYQKNKYVKNLIYNKYSKCQNENVQIIFVLLFF